ncbi:hypothetical protein B0H16DRAFT_1814741 [Mycena metata]|uniref:Uncharacterized protein n=1 Tax=Mycena metata TaxID=1033252 RepID=A0AAD7H536_9AGAR|nr:hypothetical protein B0H16DRAFT_1814741 [Mycena metata]
MSKLYSAYLGAADVPLQAGAQDANERAGSEHAYWFVCRDEAEWVDLRRRVKELPRTIFAIVDEPPMWPGADDDDDMGLENISDSEEVADAGFEGADGDGDGDVSSVSHASHVVSSASHVAASTFSHTHARHGSNSNTHSTSTTSISSGARSSEVDTEEDSVAPITPLPGSRFDLSGGPTRAASAAMSKGKTAGDVYPELEGDNSFVDADGEIEIEDDWVDPLARARRRSSRSRRRLRLRLYLPLRPHRARRPAMSVSPPHREREQERQRNVTRAGGGITGQQMHTARGRDGGRTQIKFTHPPMVDTIADYKIPTGHNFFSEDDHHSELDLLNSEIIIAENLDHER